MLCSNCYKKIPEGEEVQKSGSGYYRVNGWGGGWGSGIYCKKCAIKKDQRDRRLLIIFFSIWGLFMVLGIVIFVCVKLST